MFSWSKPPAPAPAASSSTSPSSPMSRTIHSISRTIHLSSYLNHPVLKPSTRKVSNDDTIYDTVFQTINGFALILRVYLPVDINRAPSMSLHGVRASHNWLDIRMKVIGYTPISSDQSWRSSGMKLGDAVDAVIRHLQLTPPSIMEITDTNLKRLQETISGPSNRPTRPANNFPPSPRQNVSSHIDNSRPANRPGKNEIVEQKVNYEVEDCEVSALIPPIPPSFLEIDSMSLSELNLVTDDKAVLENFVENTSGVKTLKELKQSIEMSNVDAAKANLVHEGEMEGLCVEVESLKQNLNSKMQQYRKLDAERVAITHPPDLQDVIGELNKAKKEAYRESEALADEWVDSGGDNVNNFVKKFMEMRLLYHTRAAKVESLENSM